MKLTTNQGDTPWSDAGSWSMALLDDSEWKATWIGEDSLSNPGEEVGVAGGNNKTRLAARYLRKEFTTDRAVERAVLYISGLGSYEAYLNGKKVSEDVFAPMPSLYYKRIYYNVYDVTALMASDKNTLGVILGNGRFFSMRNPGMKTFGLVCLRNFGSNMQTGRKRRSSVIRLGKSLRKDRSSQITSLMAKNMMPASRWKVGTRTVSTTAHGKLPM